MKCGQCTYYKQCDIAVGKWRIDECPKMRYIYNSTVDNRALWLRKYYDPITKECLEYVRSPIEGKCHGYQECRILLTDYTTNPIIWRYEMLTEHKCPSSASFFDSKSLECTKKTAISCGILFSTLTKYLSPSSFYNCAYFIKSQKFAQ